MKTYFLPLLLALLVSCSSEQEAIYIENTGRAQGSTYQIKYESPEGEDFAEDIQAIFKRIDLSMSTYVPTSIISTVNQGDTLVQVDSLFLDVLNRSIEIAKETEGDFDPTIGPLVRLWGFGFDELRQDVSKEMVEAQLSNTGFEHIQIKGDSVIIPKDFQIDFNAIAQGYTVDYLSEFLESHSVANYMVEVGGEVRTKGVNDSNEIWTIGVDKPKEEIDTDDRFQFILKLEDMGLATSGNYRKFWVDEETGARYSHTIDPNTGYPAKNSLLSASIISSSAMNADAYATVCMVKGLEDCKEFLATKNDLEGYLVYDDGNGNWGTFITDGFQKYIVR